MNCWKRFAAVFFLAGIAASFAGAQGGVRKVEIVPRVPPSPLPANAATPDQIREYFAVTHLDQALKKMLSNEWLAMRKASPSYLPSSSWEDMDMSLVSYDFINELIPIYQRRLTWSDMKDILAFYHSDAGQHILLSEPAIINEAQDRLRALGARIQGEASDRHHDEIQAAERKYKQSIADKQIVSPK